MPACRFSCFAAVPVIEHSWMYTAFLLHRCLQHLPRASRSSLLNVTEEKRGDEQALLFVFHHLS